MPPLLKHRHMICRTEQGTPRGVRFNRDRQCAATLYGFDQSERVIEAVEAALVASTPARFRWTQARRTSDRIARQEPALLTSTIPPPECGRKG